MARNPIFFDLYRFTSAGAQLINGASTAPAAYFCRQRLHEACRLWPDVRPQRFSQQRRAGRQRSVQRILQWQHASESGRRLTRNSSTLLGFHLSTSRTTTIQTDTNSVASTSLVQFFSNYYLENASTGVGPETEVWCRTPVVAGAGQFSGWAAIGAVQTSSGYDVAWKDAATNQYSVWTTDSSGNFVSSTGAVAGTSAALETYETTFNQDLNGDGVISNPTTKVVQTDGSTSLVEVGSNYFLDPVGGSSGPELNYGGTPGCARFGSI